MENQFENIIHPAELAPSGHNKMSGKFLFWVGVVFFAFFPLSLIIAVILDLQYPWVPVQKDLFQFQLITWSYCFLPIIGLLIMLWGASRRISNSKEKENQNG